MLPFAAIALAVALMLSFIPARSAYAHASLVTANPANNETLRRPPVRVVLNFSEAIERKLTEIQVRDKNDERVDNGDMAFSDTDPTLASIGVKTLPPGLYFVRWSNVSAVDGHNLQGTYPFIVLNADGSFPEGVSLETAGAATTSGGQLLPSNLDVALKWIALLSLAVVGGSAFMMLAGLRPAASFLEDEPYQKFTDAIERWVINLSHVLIPVSFIASAFLVLLAVNRFGTDIGVVSYLTTVRTGQYHLAELCLLLIALAGADVLFLGRSARKREAGLVVLIAATLGAMFTYSMVSHSAADAGKFWSVTSDFVHLAASSAWLGALVMLIPLLRWTRRHLDDAPRFLLLANAFDRFSIIAGLSVIAILATGIFNGLVEMPNASSMIDTTYGKVLLAKLALLAPLLGVAGLNAFVLKPRLVAAIDGVYQQGGAGSEEQRASWRRRLASLQRALPVTIALEVMLVVAVFAAVGLLTQTSTAKGEVAQQKAEQTAATKFNQSTEQGGLKLTLEISPNRVGLNQYDVTVQNADGTPSTTVTQARLRFNYEQTPGTVPQSEVILRKRADGEFREIGSYFSQPGNWRVQLDIRRTDGDDVSRQFIVGVAPAQSTTATAKKGVFALPFNVFSWNEVAGAFAALAGFAIVVYRKQLRWLRQPGYRIGMTVATALLLTGAVLAFGVHTHTAAVNPSADNPVKPTQESVERGRTLFQQNCVACHGAEGRGDGPQAAQLNPQPADFRLHMPYHTDGQFYGFIANGYPQSAMPQFKTAFSETDIWNLVNYLRAAFSGGASQ
jgi:copper transport protein